LNLTKAGRKTSQVSESTVAALPPSSDRATTTPSGDNDSHASPILEATSGETNPGAIAGAAGAAGVVALLIGACVWWRCCRPGAAEIEAGHEGVKVDGWLEFPELTAVDEGRQSTLNPKPSSPNH
jgi:hypothetical protein